MNPNLAYTLISAWTTIMKCYWILWIMWITSMGCTKNLVKIMLEKGISQEYINSVQKSHNKEHNVFNVQGWSTQIHWH